MNREQARLELARKEEFYRTLFKDQLVGQRKALEEQAKEIDFREARRALLDLDLQARNDSVSAKRKVKAFFASTLFREHSGKLLNSITTSDFLLRCYCEHELQQLCRQQQDPNDIDWVLDFYCESSFQPIREVYTKLIAIAKTCDPVAAGLTPELVEIIRTHPTRRATKQKQEEEEKRQQWEEFLHAYEEACQLALSSSPQKLSKLESFRRWWRWNFPLTTAQRQAHDRRWGIINALADWVEEGLRDFHADDGNRYISREMAITARLWFESRFDRRLIPLVLVHLLRQPWHDPKSAIAAAVDEFECQEF